MTTAGRLADNDLNRVILAADGDGEDGIVPAPDMTYLARIDGGSRTAENDHQNQQRHQTQAEQDYSR